jgi:hypothetical protein
LTKGKKIAADGWYVQPFSKNAIGKRTADFDIARYIENSCCTNCVSLRTINKLCPCNWFMDTQKDRHFAAGTRIIHEECYNYLAVR